MTALPVSGENRREMRFFMPQSVWPRPFAKKP